MLFPTSNNTVKFYYIITFENISIFHKISFYLEYNILQFAQWKKTAAFMINLDGTHASFRNNANYERGAKKERKIGR